MNARPRISTVAGSTLAATLDVLVDSALDTDQLMPALHTDDWPDPTAAAALPQELWEQALGDVARDILGRPSRQFRARLCGLAWRLAGGAGDVPRVLAALVEVVHAGSLIVDDIEDASVVRRGAPAAHVTHGMPRALNTGNWMYFWALQLIDELTSSPQTARDQLRRALCRTMHDCHLGQALDVSIPVGLLPRALVYRTVATSTMLKTGALMEFAARGAALIAGAPPQRVEALARFGRRLGLGLQMLDDFGNLTAPASDHEGSKALEDLRGGRPTWPWALAAQELDEPTFSELQKNVRELVAFKDASNDGTDAALARALAAKLRMAVGLRGRQRASAYLDKALADLRTAVGDRPELALVASEIERLERSYG
ncbi:MAG TPA: polyprenyl synthetase family protein [Polyangia bacterium]|nr:polyprenyl synthetase family protein [Polyangia bacterium]